MTELLNQTQTEKSVGTYKITITHEKENKNSELATNITTRILLGKGSLDIIDITEQIFYPIIQETSHNITEIDTSILDNFSQSLPKNIDKNECEATIIDETEIDAEELDTTVHLHIYDYDNISIGKGSTFIQDDRVGKPNKKQVRELAEQVKNTHKKSSQGEIQSDYYWNENHEIYRPPVENISFVPLTEDLLKAFKQKYKGTIAKELLNTIDLVEFTSNENWSVTIPIIPTPSNKHPNEYNITLKPAISFDYKKKIKTGINSSQPGFTIAAIIPREEFLIETKCFQFNTLNIDIDDSEVDYIGTERKYGSPQKTANERYTTRDVYGQMFTRSYENLEKITTKLITSEFKARIAEVEVENARRCMRSIHERTEKVVLNQVDSETIEEIQQVINQDLDTLTSISDTKKEKIREAITPYSQNPSPQ